MTKVAVVGCSHWGRNLVRNFHDLGALTHIWDTNPIKLQEIQSQYPGVTAGADYQQLLAVDEIDAVAAKPS